jgi:hypothetical protein
MLKYTLLLAGVILFSSSPKQLPWELLGLTTYKNEFKPDGDMYYIPKFPKPLESMEGEVVQVRGYMVPMDVSAKKYALSKNSFKSCFFCGNAGPETVMELRFLNPPDRFTTDEYVTVTGVLRLNRKGNDLFFTLTNTEVQ